jgi:hypothetical protein
MALKPRKAPVTDNSNKIKLGVAIGGLCVAAGLLAWNFGLFGDDIPPPPPPPPPEVQAETKKQIERQKRESEEIMRKPGTVPAGS